MDTTEKVPVMTVSQFKALPPREQEALVAERVMGWSARLVEVMRYRNCRYVDPRPTGRHRLWVTRPDGARYLCPAYSSDFDAAWRMAKRFWRVQVVRCDTYRNSVEVRIMTSNGPEVVAEAETAPLAICAAALLAMGAIVPDNLQGGE